MEDLVSTLNLYAMTLTVAYRNAHILHLNCKGHGFRSVHLQLNDVYDSLFEQIDVVGELIRIHDGIPTISLSECVEKSQIQEIKSQEYNCKDALKMELEDIEKLIEITNNIAVTFGDKYKDVDDIFSSYTSDLGKFKYFIASMI